MNWKHVKLEQPPEGVVVMTRIKDERGERNVQPLKKSGNLWFMPDGSMYVYYTPTHWKHKDEVKS